MKHFCGEKKRKRFSFCWYLGREGLVGNGVLGADLVRETKVQQHLMEFVFVGQRPARHVDGRLAAVVHGEEQALAHVDQMATDL